VLIDWFTVGAQVINFLILLILMRMFLFKPIKEAVRKREEAVAATVRKAEKSFKDLEADREELAREKLALERSRERILQKAEQDAREYLDEALEKVHEESRQARKAWQAELRREQEAVARTMRRKVAHTAFRMAGKVLADMTGKQAKAELEQQAALAFLEKLRSAELSIDETTIQGSAQLSTSFRDEDLQEQMIQALMERFPNLKELTCRVDDEMGLAIVLHAGDIRLEWSPESSLQDLESEVQEALSSSFGHTAQAAS
jgi:F-type H+-transporting ATPase subunit b